MLKAIKITGATLLAVTGWLSCKKDNFLHAIPDSDNYVVSSLSDVQAVLDKETILTNPTLMELSADAYYLQTDFWSNLNPKEKNAYVWAADIFEAQENDDDWFLPYQQVYYANIALNALAAIPVTGINKIQHNTLTGWALFMRAFAFYNLAQVFALPYDAADAQTKPGIPLRLTPYIDEVIKRATIQQTYDQVINDLLLARTLLPATIDSLHRNRPSVPAAMALLARVYVSKRDYQNAFAYADSSLRLYNTLMDYNKINIFLPLPFSKLNPEVLYQCRFHADTKVLTGFAGQKCIVDSTLYNSYTNADLRKKAYYINFNGTPFTKGTYNESVFPFCGLATDELYLIRAECNARLNNIAAATNDLNVLLVNRWQAGTFVPVSPAGKEEALQLVLDERKKELSFRGLRWTDIRRLNKEGAGITLTRIINDQVYQLPPGDPRYALPIPSDIIKRNGIPQNPR